MSPALLFIIFVVCLFASIPVSGSMAIASLAPGLMGVDSITAISFIRNAVEGVNSFSLLAIPMFILSGIVMARGGVSRKLFDFFTYFIGKIPGGMPCAVIVTCLFYGAISGSAPATVAAVGSMTIPILLNLGYTREFTVSTVCVAGSLGVIIPPSIPMVLYCMANSEASVGKMFTAGILPGFLIAGCLMVYAVFYCLKHGEDKEKINKEVTELRQRGFVKVFFTSFWALLSPVIILGSIYGGIASPTEAATISVFYALIVGLFIYRTLKVQDIPAILQETVQTYGPLLFVLGAAAAFAKVMAMLQIPAMVSDFMIATFHSKFMILLIVNIFLFFVGMVMDGGPAILLLTPILWPIVSAVGVNEIHFGIMMIVNLAIGFVTPPIGINLFVASRVGELPVMTVAKNVMPYICLFVVALVAIITFPGISLTLVGGSTTSTATTGGAAGVEAIEAEYSTDNLEKLDVDAANISEHEWFLGTDSSEDTVTQLYAQKFAELVNYYSDGKMTITVQANGTLGSDNALCESVKTQDGVNFVVQTTAPEVNFIPELAVFDAACVYGDINEVRMALDDAEFMETINGLYEKGGYKLLGYADQNYRELSTNTEVTKMADLSGQKIRTMDNANHLAFWTACGANPTPMAFSEVYTSLQNNTIDGQENPYEVIVGNKFYEVQKYVVTTNHLPHILALITGADMYNSLNDDEKAILDAAVNQAKAYAREQADARAGDRIAAIEAGGATVMPFNPDLFAEMQAAAQGEWDQIKQATGEELFNAYTKYMVNINTENVGEHQWFLGTDSSEDTVTQLYAEKFAELVNQYSGGKMNIVIQANGTLGSDNALCESVKAQDGVNFVVQTTAPEVNFIPELAVFDAACVYSDINDVREALDNQTFMDTVSGLYEKGGYKLMGFADQNFRELSTNVEVKTLADLAGQKIRTMENDNHLKFWSGCGANPTPMAFSEVYTSLQNGTIDGQENPYEVIVGNKFYEVQKYVVTTNHLPHILALITGADMYNNLNDDEKAVLDAAVLRAKAYAREQADSRAAARIAAIEAGGSTVLPLNPDLFAEMQEAAQPEWEQIRSAVGDELFNAYTQQ